MPHARSQVRRAAAFAALATLLGVATLTLSQCTLVGDNVTGVDLSMGGATTCIKQCNDLYKMLYDQEQKLHQTNIALCGQDNGPCKEAEAARHEAAKIQLSADKTACQDGCHSQGTGSGG
jgi:hypothetical protein